MDRRTFVKGSIAATGALAMPNLALAQTGPVRIGVVGAKTGPLAAGAATTHFPPFKLWAKEVNDAGGLKLKGGQRKVELIEYDDRTQPGEAIKAVERLATVDKADFIMGLYGTGFNVAAAPIFGKYEYPQICVAAITDQVNELAAKYPGFFFFNGTVSDYAAAAVNIFKTLKDEGKIGNRLVVVNIADTFGIEIANKGNDLFKKAGFELVYTTSYPFTAPDFSPIVKASKAAKPDAFVAWSYPPDTFGLTEAAKIEGFDVKAYFTGVGTGFKSFKAKFGASAENVMGLGGIENTPAMQKYYQDLKAATGSDGDFTASPNYYAMLHMVQQAAERVGSMDRKAITEDLKTHEYETLIGKINMKNQRLSSAHLCGQWQGDLFHGVSGLNRKASVPIKLKTGWA